jgi:hypothetical protein
LSSVFLLNTVGVINEHALEQLELVVECTKSVRVRDDGAAESKSSSSSSSSSGSGSVSDLAPHFPSFLWVLRDFALMLQDSSGRPISSKEYLEENLRPISEKHKNHQAKNHIRHVIKVCASTDALLRMCVCLCVRYF